MPACLSSGAASQPAGFYAAGFGNLPRTQEQIAILLPGDFELPSMGQADIPPGGPTATGL